MIRSIENAEHYTWGDGCDAWHLVKSANLSVIQEIMPPGTNEQLHYHEHAQQLFYVLSGTASFEIDGKTIEVKTHQSVHIPKNSKHYIFNNTDADLSFLVISQPRSHGDRVNVPHPAKKKQ
jgi:mannose-6-phosphate isomerase-like protein (cupin superfamily)